MEIIYRMGNEGKFFDPMSGDATVFTSFSSFSNDMILSFLLNFTYKIIMNQLVFICYTFAFLTALCFTSIFFLNFNRASAVLPNKKLYKNVMSREVLSILDTNAFIPGNTLNFYIVP
jgi:hypothetical protein